MEFKKIGTPCRNYCVMGVCSGIDPRTGRELFAATFFAPAATGKLIFTDTETYKTEGYDFPEDDGAWGVIYDDGCFLVSTCTKYGSLQRFDLHERKWTGGALRAKEIDGRDNYLYGFARGSDGNIYAGTYGGCNLYRYLPKKHKLELVGGGSDNPENMYCRPLSGDVPGRIYFTCGVPNPEIGYYDIEQDVMVKGWKSFPAQEKYINVKQFESDYLLIGSGSSDTFYDPVSGNLLFENVDFNCLTDGQKNEPVIKRVVEKLSNDPYTIYKKAAGADDHAQTPRALRLKNGDIFGFIPEGNSFFKIKNEKTAEFIENTVEAPIAAIHYLTADSDGTLWGCASMGMTAFEFEPVSGKYENFYVPGNGGEPYGMVPAGNKVYMTGYSRGDFIVYDKTRPKELKKETNPWVEYNVGPEYVRPHTYSHMDKNGDIWTGWWSKYGTRQMCLTKWDVKHGSVSVYEHLKKDTTCDWLQAADGHIWFTTSNYANGLADLSDPIILCAASYDGELVFEKEFPKGVKVGKFGFAKNLGLLPAGGDLYRIDDSAFDMQKIDIGSYLGDPDEKIVNVLKLDNRLLAVIGENRLYIVEPATAKVVKIVEYTVENGEKIRAEWVAAHGDKIYMSHLGAVYESP